jgi:hypothetical protein
MDLFKYIANNKDSQREALKIVRENSRVSVRNPQELESALTNIYKNLRIEDKEKFLIRLSEIHPDRELYQNEIVESDADDNYLSNQCSCPYCVQARTYHEIGTHVGANGLNAVSHFMQSGGLLTQNDSQLSKEVESIKQESLTNKLLNDKILKLVVYAIAGYLLYKYINKAN